MLKNTKVTLVNKATGTIDEFGGYVEGGETAKDIYVNIQPYSKDLLLKNYGYDIEVSKRIFCDIDKDIKVGSIIKFNNEVYEVRKIPWDFGHMEVFCNEL